MFDLYGGRALSEYTKTGIDGISQGIVERAKGHISENRERIGI